MSNVDQVVATNTVTNATTAGNTELAVATLTGISPPRPGGFVLLNGYVSFTTGANITSARLRVERGTVAGGTAVGDTGVDPSGVAASSICTKNVDGLDATPGDVAQAAYVLTLTTAGGSPGNSTIQFVVFTALVYH